MKTSELRELSEKELKARKKELSDEHFHLRLKHSGGQLENTSKLRETKRTLARINTLLAEAAAKTNT